MKATHNGKQFKYASEQDVVEHAGPRPEYSERAESGKYVPDPRTTAETISIQERIRLLRLAIEILSRKWHITVLHHLSGGALRASQLQRALEEVAPKVLTQTLRGLERNGLVERTTYAFVPPHVEYQLTDMAESLLAALGELCRWSEKYGRETLLARNTYDAQKNNAVVKRSNTSSSQILKANIEKRPERRFPFNPHFSP